MESKLAHDLKYKVTKLQPAIFADNITRIIAIIYGGDWELKFSTQESFDHFRDNYSFNILIDIVRYIKPWYASLHNFREMQFSNEDSLSKILYIFKTRFHEKSDDDAKSLFVAYCSIMVYFAVKKYKRGVKTAITMAFLEVYNLACYYLERMNYKHDLISILNQYKTFQ